MLIRNKEDFNNFEDQKSDLIDEKDRNKLQGLEMEKNF